MAVTRPSVGILVKRFPKLSETFILSEILALEALGWPVTIFTLAPPSDDIAHSDVARVKAKIVQLDLAHPARHLEQLLRSRNIRHIHGHFANEPAAIVRQAAHAAGIGYSISAHAKDIYLTAPDALRANLSDARFVVTCTSYNAEFLRKALPGVPIAKLYHGIDCGKLHGAQGDVSGSGLRILSVGRLRAKKGFDTLIAACALLRDRGIAASCEIAGYGPEGAALRQQITSLRLQDQVTLTGKLGHDEVLNRMRAADLFVLPCRVDADGDRDGIPNVILEAMATGLPVVSTPVSGIPEVIEHGTTGWLVPPDNTAALADEIARLAARPEEMAPVAAAGREAVRRRFGAGRDIAMLDRLLAGANSSVPAGIGYVVKGFPRLSESFISAEVLRLEARGKRLAVFALSDGDELAAPVLTELSSPLAYMPSAGSVSKNSLLGWLSIVTPAYAPIHWRLFRKRPRAWLAAFAQTVAMSRRYRYRADRCAKRAFFKQFAQAGAIAEALPRAGITHLHGHFCHSAATITWLAARMAGVSFSFTAHAKDIYQEKHNPGDLLHRKVDAARFVTTCTRANHDHLGARLGEAPRLHTVYHGLDTRLFAPVERFTEAMPQLIAVGRHVEKKGFDVLLEALALLAARGSALTCRIVGETGPATAGLKEAIVRLELEASVSLDPPEPQAILKRSYGAADIFVLPCRIDDSGDRDGIPNVLAEAMATGLAVVSTDVSGIPELVRSGDNGLLVAPGDAAALADAIERLATDAVLRARLGGNAVKTIHDVFDAERTIVDLDRLFDETLRQAA